METSPMRTMCPTHLHLASTQPWFMSKMIEFNNANNDNKLKKQSTNIVFWHAELLSCLGTRFLDSRRRHPTKQSQTQFKNKKQSFKRKLFRFGVVRNGVAFDRDQIGRDAMAPPQLSRDAPVLNVFYVWGCCMMNEISR